MIHFQNLHEILWGELRILKCVGNQILTHPGPQPINLSSRVSSEKHLPTLLVSVKTGLTWEEVLPETITFSAPSLCGTEFPGYGAIYLSDQKQKKLDVRV